MAAKRLRKVGLCVSTSNCSPVSASRRVSRPRSGSSSSSGSVRRTAMTSWRSASWPRGFSQPGSLMKSDTTKMVERRWMALAAASSSSESFVPPALVCSARPALLFVVAEGCTCCMACSRCSTCARLARAGIIFSTPAPYSSAPTRLPCRVSSRASTATNSADTWRLRSMPEPKSTDGLRSSRNHAAISRSSVNTRTCGVCMRAVTFQSMWRTSSCIWYSRRSARSSPLPRISVR